MLKKNLTIVNKLGLHARATMKLVNLAGRYQSEILIHYNDRKVDAKNIIDVMVLGITFGSSFEVIVSGKDEEEAMQAVEALINDKFGESE